MCEYPAVVCQLVARVFEVDGPLGAQQQRALQTRHGGGRVARRVEVDEGHGPRRAAAARQQPQPREPSAAATSTLTCVRTGTSTALSSD